MAKKSKHAKQKKSLVPQVSQADKLFDLIGHQVFTGNYEEAVANSERLLNYLPKNAPLRADVLAQMGTAQAMLQNYYALAKRNLRMMPETRRTGPPEIIGLKDPFKDSKLKQSITFIQE